MAISAGPELNRKDPGKIVELVVNLDGLEMSQQPWELFSSGTSGIDMDEDGMDMYIRYLNDKYCPRPNTKL